MDFKTKEEALKYLYGLEQIIIPPQFTYFNHCTSYQAALMQEQTPFKKAWTKMPIDGFVITKEMSFTERNQRIDEALEYGGKERASTNYAMPHGTKEFMIRVIMPKHNLSKDEREKLGISEEYSKIIRQEYMGLGNMRHPKLRKGEHILMFASSTIDEVSGKHIDILYGIKAQDIIRYANAVSHELSIQDIFEECDIPTPKRVEGEAYYEWDHDYKFNRETYAIPRDKTFARYLRKSILDPSGKVTLYQASDFEQEYLNELSDYYTNSIDDETTYTSHYKK